MESVILLFFLPCIHLLPVDETMTVANDFDTDTRAKGVWDDYHVVDGRLVSGMSPQSAKSTTVAAVETFEKL